MPDDNSRTLLSWAAEKGHEAVVQLLLESKVDVNAKDMYGRTPLLCAAKKGHKAIVQLLLKSKADADANDLLHLQ